MSDLTPLKLEVHGAGAGTGELVDNINHALSLGIPEFYPGLVPHDGTFVVVGSSPSLGDHLDDIAHEKAEGRVVCAVNGAHDILIEKAGVIPTLFLTVDPRAMAGVEPRPEVNNFRHVNDETVYLIASRAHPSTFEAVRGRRVIMFHALGAPEENDVLLSRTRIGGGSTSGTRAMYIGHALGFRRFILYGMDSCLGEVRNKHFEGPPLDPDVATVDVHVGGREFLCNMAMAAQANEFQMVYQAMPDITVQAVGDGLIAAILAERKTMGMHV